MLSVQGIRFGYDPERPVLADVSFSMDRGDVVCLLGPNGTGKTTLLRCLMGLSRPQAGTVELDGRDIGHLSARRRSQLLAYVPQSSDLAFAYDVTEVVLMGRVAHLPLGARHSADDERVALGCLERLGISHLANRTFQELSGGERQMVCVARAMAQQADYLVMDEPTASLDYGNQVRVLQMIAGLADDGYGILMTSHFPDHAFLACTGAVLVRDGRVLAQGRPEEVVTTQNLTRLYGTSVCVTDADVFGRPARVCVPVVSRSAHGGPTRPQASASGETGISFDEPLGERQ